MAIRLRKARDFVYHGKMTYHVVYCDAAGKANRYDIYVRTATDPVRFGCELDLKTVRELIADCEASPMGYLGSRRDALAFLKKVMAARLDAAWSGVMDLVPSR